MNIGKSHIYSQKNSEVKQLKRLSYSRKMILKIFGEIYYGIMEMETILSILEPHINKTIYPLKLSKNLLIDPIFEKNTYSIHEIYQILLSIKLGKVDIQYIYSILGNNYKKILLELWLQYKGLQDKGFLKELKLNFSNRLWEMHIGVYLNQKKLLNLIRENHGKIYSRTQGPDYMLINGVYIECTDMSWGEHPHPIIIDPAGKGRMRRVPVLEIKQRFNKVLEEKTKKYQLYLTKDWFNSKSAFVLAINTYLSRSSDLDYCKDFIDENKIFENPKYSFLSAIIISNLQTEADISKLGNHMFVIYNPYCKEKISKSLLELPEYRREPPVMFF